MYTTDIRSYKTISPLHLELDFLLDTGATLNVLDNNTWNEIKVCNKLQLKASKHLLSQQQITITINWNGKTYSIPRHNRTQNFS